MKWRLTYSSHLLQGHQDVSTTMIYNHFLNSGPLVFRSPTDNV